jgi:hypothetical protein
MNSAEVKQQPVATPGGMVLRSRRWVYQVECKLNKRWLGSQGDVIFRMLFWDINNKENAWLLIWLVYSWSWSLSVACWVFPVWKWFVFRLVLSWCLIKHAYSSKTTAMHTADSINRLNNNNS